MTARLGHLAAAVGLVVAQLFTDDEVEEVRLVARRGAAGLAEVMLAVTACGEESGHFLWTAGQVEESPHEVQERIAGELQDFIAESRFGWGEQRVWTPPPAQ